MKMCDKHWQDLRAAVQARGMWHLVSQSGEEAAERVKESIEQQQSTPTSFDPLMNANMNIWSRALELGGMYLMTTKEDGSEYCPLCELGLHNGQEWPQKWIDGATEAEKQRAIELGLIKKETMQ